MPDTELAAIAFFEVDDAFDEQGNLRPLGELPEAIQRVLMQAPGREPRNVLNWARFEALKATGRRLGMGTSPMNDKEKVSHD